jgi:hypothetical protein
MAAFWMHSGEFKELFSERLVLVGMLTGGWLVLLVCLTRMVISWCL